MLLTFTEFPNPRTPKTKNMQVNYEIIIGGDLSDAVKEMLALGTQQRRLLVQSLTYAGSTPNPMNLIGAANAYLPAVWHIQKSLEFSKDTRIKINAPLHFEWTSVLCPKNFPEDRKSQAQGVFVFEVTFILVVRALSHYNAARQEIEKIFAKQRESNSTLTFADPMVSQCLKESIKQLRIGAGVLDFTANDVINQWKKPPKDPLPETRPTVLTILAQYFLCQAQRVFIATAILSNKISLVPNLLMGLANKTQVIAAVFQREYFEIAGVNAICIDPEYVDETLFWTDFAVALASRFSSRIFVSKVDTGDLGVESIEEGVGKAVGHSRVALKGVSAKHLKKLCQRQTLAGKYLQNYSSVVKLLAKENQDLEEENTTVYYAMVDMEQCELPPRSQHKFLITVEKFELPQVDPLSFEQILIAPPTINQKDFNQLPKNIQMELIEEHKRVEAEKLAQQPKSKKGGFFGKKKKQEAAVPEITYECPTGVNAKIFYKLPKDKQAEIVKKFAVSPVPAPAPAAVPQTTGLTPPPGVDPSVFAELPPDIQRELASGGGRAGSNPNPNVSNDRPLW